MQKIKIVQNYSDQLNKEKGEENMFIYKNKGHLKIVTEKHNVAAGEYN